MLTLPTYQCRIAWQIAQVREEISDLAACFPEATEVQSIANEAIPCRLTIEALLDIYFREVNAALCWLSSDGSTNCVRPWECDFLQIYTGENFMGPLHIYDPFARGFEFTDLITQDFDIWFNPVASDAAYPMSFLRNISMPVTVTVFGSISCVLEPALQSFVAPVLQYVGGDLNVNSNTALTEVIFTALQEVGGSINVGAMLNPALLLPNLTTVGGDISIGGNLVAAIDISSLTTFDGDFDASDASLPADQINGILIQLDTACVLSNKLVKLDAGGNAAPTGAGITAAANLTGRGCTVMTN